MLFPVVSSERTCLCNLLDLRLYALLQNGLHRRESFEYVFQNPKCCSSSLPNAPKCLKYLPEGKRFYWGGFQGVLSQEAVGGPSGFRHPAVNKLVFLSFFSSNCRFKPHWDLPAKLSK